MIVGLEKRKKNLITFLSTFRGIKLLGEEEIRSEVKMILDLWLARQRVGSRVESYPEEFFKKGPYNLAKSRKESEEDLDWAKIWGRERERGRARVRLERRNGINGERREAGGRWNGKRWKRRGRGERKKEEERSKEWARQENERRTSN